MAPSSHGWEPPRKPGRFESTNAGALTSRHSRERPPLSLDARLPGPNPFSETLENRKEYVACIAGQKRNGQWRDRSTLGNREIEEANHSSRDSRDEEPSRISPRWDKRFCTDLLLEAAKQV